MYTIRMYVSGSKHNYKNDHISYCFQFSTLKEFRHEFLKRFGNISMPSSNKYHNETIKRLTYNMNSFRDILPWAKKISTETMWNIKIQYIRDKQTTYYNMYDK